MLSPNALQERKRMRELREASWIYYFLPPLRLARLWVVSREKGAGVPLFHILRSLIGVGGGCVARCRLPCIIHTRHCSSFCCHCVSANCKNNNRASLRIIPLPTQECKFGVKAGTSGEHSQAAFCQSFL